MNADNTDLMRLINFLIYENRNLKNGISELKVKCKKLFEENYYLKIEKNRAMQNFFKTKKLLLEMQQLKAEKNELKVKLRNLLK